MRHSGGFRNSLQASSAGESLAVSIGKMGKGDGLATGVRQPTVRRSDTIERLVAAGADEAEEILGGDASWLRYSRADEN